MTSTVDQAIIPDPDATAPAVPENAVPITLPVMAVEGLETSDGRFIAPGGLTTRTLPIPLYAQTRSVHGDEGDAATWLVGAITKATRMPGPEVTQKSTGQPFAEGTYVWVGEGWMYTDVPDTGKSAYTLVRDGALTGNSVDLSAVEAEFEYDGDHDLGNELVRRIVMHTGVIAATTLVGQPAFPDAYISLDGQPMDLGTVTAGGTPAWRCADLGDTCSPCEAGDELVASADSLALLDTLLEGDSVDPDALTRKDGMVALIPDNPALLTVDGGDPPDQLHLTLAYLGEDVTGFDPLVVEGIHAVVQRLTGDRDAAMEAGLDGGSDIEEMGERPLTGTIFAHAVFNPDDQDAATVYLLDGSADRERIDALHHNTVSDLRSTIGEAHFPEQHEPYVPYVPHVTAGYGLPPGALTYTGPVTFDRIRVALGDQVTDYPMGGGVTLAASAAPELPPLSWFQDPQLDGPTALTVDDDGRVYGHLACWGTCHIGFQGQCITPPKSASNYAYFRVHATTAADSDGDPVTVPVGYGTIGTGGGAGHADLRMSATEAAAHYDQACTAAFELAAGEDEHGIWVAGRLMPGLDEVTAHRARGTVFSGDWRTVRGQLELVAALGVNVPGFPVPRARVASGTPLAMVAAGVVHPADVPTVAAAGVSSSELAAQAVIAWVEDQRARQWHADQLSVLADAVGDADPQRATVLAEAELLLTLDGDHEWFKGKNWVEKAGGLPAYIKRIASHLRKEGGMDESHAIATAVNAAKKMCATGDLNFPGHQDVNPGSRAEACAAVAEWDAKRAGS